MGEEVPATGNGEYATHRRLIEYRFNQIDKRLDGFKIEHDNHYNAINKMRTEQAKNRGGLIVMFTLVNMMLIVAGLILAWSKTG